MSEFPGMKGPISSGKSSYEFSGRHVGLTLKPQSGISSILHVSMARTGRKPDLQGKN